MAEDFRLPSEPSGGLNIQLELNAGEVAYLLPMFQDRKRDGETPTEFVRRILRVLALRHRHEFISKQAAAEAESSANKAYQDKIDFDKTNSTIVSRVEQELDA